MTNEGRRVSLGRRSGYARSAGRFKAACEIVFIRAALLLHLGHNAETADALSIPRKSLWEKMRKRAIAAAPLY
ncbi:helix-turn-helix domain-containing protein [Paraburkholderia fungorum]